MYLKIFEATLKLMNNPVIHQMRKKMSHSIELRPQFRRDRKAANFRIVAIVNNGGVRSFVS